MNNIKRSFYIFCAMVLGFLLTLLVHATIEIWYIDLLVSDFSRYSLGLTWDTWRMIHNVLAVFLATLGIWFGYRLGVRWWQIVYVEKRHWFLKHHIK